MNFFARPGQIRPSPKPLISDPPPAADSAERRALRDTQAVIGAARVAVSQQEARVTRLQEVLVTAEQTEKDFHRVVAAADLAEMERLLTENKAGRAAVAARGALPHAEKALAESRVELERLIELQEKQIDLCLAERAKFVAQKYAALFRELCAYCDELNGYDRVVRPAQNNSEWVPPRAMRVATVPAFDLPGCNSLNHCTDDQTPRWDRYAIALRGDAADVDKFDPLRVPRLRDKRWSPND